MRDPEHISAVMQRVVKRYRPRSHLAPLEPDAFLRWVFERVPHHRGDAPLTLEDIWWELRIPEYPIETLRRDYVRVAAKVRRNQRLGRDPFEGIC